MPASIELVVDECPRLKDLPREDVGRHRRRLAVHLKAQTGFNYCVSIGKIEKEIATIEASLRILSGPIS